MDSFPFIWLLPLPLIGALRIDSSVLYVARPLTGNFLVQYYIRTNGEDSRRAFIQYEATQKPTVPPPKYINLELSWLDTTRQRRRRK